MFAKPQAQHQWLQQLVGCWRVQSQSRMGADAPPQESSGRMTCRMLGDLWLIAESQWESPEGDVWSSIMTLGFDPQQERYIGTFVASVMTHLWPYCGVVDGSGMKLSLDSEGPKFTGSGMTKYRDAIVIIDHDHWKLSGEAMADDGSWQMLMSSDHYRER